MTDGSQSERATPPALPVVVDNDDALAEVRALVQRAPWLGLSLELNAARSYRRRICLVQLNVGGRCVAIDPLAFAGRRPEPLAELLAALPAGAPAIVHGGEYALMALERELHVRFGELVDLQQAAVLLGMPATGLRSLCAELIGVQLPAPLSLDWLQRPLSAEAVAHALADVEPLGALYEALMPLIMAADLTDELALASRPPPARPSVTPDTPDPRRYRRIPGAATLDPEGLALLGALVRWRDYKAKELDVPPGQLLTNALLVELAHAPDRALQRLASMRFHSRLVHADLEALRRVVLLAGSAEPGQGAHAPPAEVKHDPLMLQATTKKKQSKDKKKGPPSAAVKQRLARLKAWRRDEAEARGVGLQAVLPGAALEHLAFFPETPLADVPSFGRRRGERYAEVLRRILNDG